MKRYYIKAGTIFELWCLLPQPPPMDFDFLCSEKSNAYLLLPLRIIRSLLIGRNRLDLIRTRFSPSLFRRSGTPSLNAYFIWKLLVDGVCNCRRTSFFPKKVRIKIYLLILNHLLRFLSSTTFYPMAARQ